MAKDSGDDLNKRLVEITYENFHKKYLIGRIYEGEVHIKLDLLQEYYRVNHIDLPHSFLNNMYEVSILSGKKTHNTNRYNVSNVVKIIKNNSEIVETYSDNDLDRRFQENNDMLMKEFQRMSSQMRNEYEMKFNEYKNTTDAQIMFLEKKINVLRMILHRISKYTFLSDII
jgi:hypothetical protein